MFIIISPCGQKVCFPVRFADICLEYNVSLAQYKDYFAQSNIPKVCEDMQGCPHLILKCLHYVNFSQLQPFTPFLLFKTIQHFHGNKHGKTWTAQHIALDSIPWGSSIIFKVGLCDPGLGCILSLTLHTIRTQHLLVTYWLPTENSGALGKKRFTLEPSPGSWDLSRLRP